MDKRIAVVGIGGVGGYLGGMLSAHLEHVTLVARGARGESIRERGLVLHSDYKGELVARPERVASSIGELGEQDVIFLCVKNYSLEGACEELKPCVTADTVIVPVMNGVDAGERVRRCLGTENVVSALIYIVSFSNPDYSVTQQGGHASLRIGVQNPSERDRENVRAAAEILETADIDYKISQDIEKDIWRKYILNCAYNVATACYDRTIGQLRSDPETAAEYEQLVWEAYRVAEAKGVHVLPEHAESIIRRFYGEMSDGATSSLQRDVVAGRPSEVETFSGYVMREAHRLGIAVPVTERMYGRLKELEACGENR